MTSRETIGERIRKLRLKAILTQGELAQKVGVTLGSVSQWELGTNNPRPRKMAILAEIFNVDVEWLYSGQPDLNASSASSSETLETQNTYSLESDSDLKPDQMIYVVSLADHLRLVPKLDFMPLSFPRSDIDEESARPILSDWIIRGGYNPQHLAAYDVEDEAMSPSILKGDVVFVDRSQKAIDNGRVYLIRKEGSYFIRRISIRVKGITLEADNYSPEYQHETFTKEEFSHVDVVGRVVLRTGAL